MSYSSSTFLSVFSFSIPLLLVVSSSFFGDLSSAMTEFLAGGDGGDESPFSTGEGGATYTHTRTLKTCFVLAIVNVEETTVNLS